MTTTHTTQADDRKLQKIADTLAADRELYEAALDGLEGRIEANIAALETSDIDAAMAAADEDVAQMAVKALQADAADMEELDKDINAADAEEDQLLADDELPVAETSEKLTPEETGLGQEVG
jgi:hypothetical protein